MKEVNVEDLTGKQLDWAVGQALNGNKLFFKAFGAEMLGRTITSAAASGRLSPSKKWEQCGPIIEHFNIEFYTSCGFEACINDIESMTATTLYGESHLEAACRAVVAFKLGDVVQIPDELVN